MKARTPRIYRVFVGPVSIKSQSLSPWNLHYIHNYFNGPRPAWVRLFSSTAVRPKFFSLADHIKQFIPAEASQESEESELDLLLDSEPENSLAAYEAEIAESLKLVEKFDFANACRHLLGTLPLQTVLGALIARIVPAIRNGPTRELGVVELAFQIYDLDQFGLANQLLQELGLEGNAPAFSLVSKLTRLTPNNLRTSQLDDLLHAAGSASSNHASSRKISAYNFPQMLSNPDLSRWVKARILLQLCEDDFEHWLLKYASHFDASFITLLAVLAPKSHFKALSNYIVKYRDTPGLVVSVMNAVQSPDKFRNLNRRLLRRDPVSAEVEVAMLATALRLKQTYDIANICKHGAKYISHPEHTSLLAKALLAAAFAQRKPEDELSLFGPVNFSNSSELRTFLVSRVLSSVLEDDFARNSVVGAAATRLHRQYNRHVPGKVLWRLISSLSGPLSGPSTAPLARLLITRPYSEQIRFMSLPAVSSSGITQLLKWHITKIVEYRRINGVNAAIPQAREDIQLLVVGMYLASEKKLSKDSSGLQQDSLLAVVNQTFADLPGSGSLDLSALTTAESDRALAASIAFYVIAELVRQKSYTVAKQLLKMVGPEKLPNSVLSSLLVNLAQDQPEDSYKFVNWLVKVNQVPVSPWCINEMLRILTNSNLTESQLMNRFQSLRILLRTSLNTSVEPTAAICLVDAFIRNAYLRGRGSQLRLKWALQVAQFARVPQSEFDRWNAQLEKMHEERTGYWTDTPL